MKLKLKILSLIPIGLIGAGAAFSTTSCSKSGYTKDFKNFNELSKFANAGSKLTDSATFKDGYEAGLWFDQHANADFIAHVIALNLCNITQHELIPLLGQLLESFTELHLSIENKKTDAQYGGNGWFIDINAAGSLPEEKGATWHADFSTSGFMKMFYMHNQGEYNPASPETGHWFNIVVAYFLGDDYQTDETIGVAAATITASDGSSENLFENITSEKLPLQILDNWTPNLVFDYSNDTSAE